MQLRTFLAKDMKSALAEVREEMGPEAVIVASQSAKGGGVMVRAALEDAEAEVEFEPEPAPVPQDIDSVFHETLIRRLREKKAELPGRRRFDRAELLTAFARNRVPESIAHVMTELAAKTGLGDMTLALAAAIDVRLNPAPVDFAAAKAVLLLGPNGSGKSAVAAKLAAHARLIGRAVTLIAGDVSGAGAVARLKDFADHLGAAVVTADSAVTLAGAIAAAEDSLAIVDTAGFDPRQPKAAAAFAALAKIENLESVGVVSALTDGEELGEIIEALGKIGVAKLIATGADLARRMGGLAAAVLTPGMGFAYVTRTPFVAGGLENLTPLALARLLVETETGAL